MGLLQRSCCHLWGDTAILGSPNDGVHTGAAYIFERRPGGEWEEVSKLTADDGQDNDKFGFSVGISGDWAVIGAYGDDEVIYDSRGSPYIFKRQLDGTWSQVQKLAADDHQEDYYFGYSVALGGDTALIGAPGNTSTGSRPTPGQAYLFQRQTDDSWLQVEKLTAPDGRNTDRFGFSVAMLESRIIVGVPDDDDSGGASGAAYVFQKSGDTWHFQDKLRPEDGESGMRFGYSVALSGPYAVIGAPFLYSDERTGAAYMYQCGCTRWFEKAKVTDPDARGALYFGWAVALSPEIVAVGGPGGSCSGLPKGVTYVYEIGLCPNISASTDTIDFGGVDLGASGQETVFVFNYSTDDLGIGDLLVSGADRTQFGIVEDTCSDQTLNPGDACTAVLEFHPTSGGTKSGVLSVPSTDPDTPQLSVSLTGAGAGPPSCDIGDILPQAVRQGDSVTFLVTCDTLGSGTSFTMSVNGSPEGTMQFDSATGRFTYSNDAGDTDPFTVTFKGTSGNELLTQVVEI